MSQSKKRQYENENRFSIYPNGPGKQKLVLDLVKTNIEIFSCDLDLRASSCLCGEGQLPLPLMPFV